MAGLTGMFNYQRLLRNYKVKLLALASAIFLWLFVATNNDYYQTIDVPIQVINLPENTVLVDEVPLVAKVLLRGGGKDLINLSSRDKVLYLDLENQHKRKRFVLEPAMVSGIPADMNVSVEQIWSPDTVQVKTDALMRRRLPVVSALDVRLTAGFTQNGPVLCEPDSVWVEGPAVTVEKLEAVPTESLMLEDVHRDLSREVKLADAPGVSVHYSRDDVVCTLDIQRIGERVIDNIPLRVINIPRRVHDVRVVPSSLSLTVQGGVDILAALEAQSITATIDFNKWRPGKKVNAFISLPESILYYEASPKSFELMIE